MLHETVALPLWLVILAGAFAVVAVLDRLLVPSARWFIHRRLRRLIERLNQRLEIRIPFFALTERRILIDNLAYDAQVLDAAEAEARRTGEPRELVIARAARYAREIVPAFNAYLYFRVGTWLARRLARNLYRVRLHAGDERALAESAQDATVVFLVNHRSNMDYVLLAFLAARRTALSFAAGDWARVWPLGSLVRAMGAYFVRRPSSRPPAGDNRLYRAVLQRYVQMATAGGVTQVIFPEGRLSRDGALGPPKLGLIDYMLRSFRPGGERDILFVPVGLNYDRVLEDRELVSIGDAQATRQSTRRAMGAVTRFLVRNLVRSPRRSPRRLGYAAVQFGPGVSLGAYLEARGARPDELDPAAHRALVADFGYRLMAAIGAQVPATPVPLIATLFTQAPSRCLSETELAAGFDELVTRLEAAGALVQLPAGGDHEAALAAGLEQLVGRRLIAQSEAGYRPAPGSLPLVTYYANSIGHLAGLKPRE